MTIDIDVLLGRKKWYNYLVFLKLRKVYFIILLIKFNFITILIYIIYNYKFILIL
jgi:hypothetical protein